MAFESSVVPEDWRFAVIFPVHKGKGERTECMKVGVAGKVCPGILVDRIHGVTGGLIDDEQGYFRAGRVCKSDLHTKADR